MKKYIIRVFILFIEGIGIIIFSIVIAISFIAIAVGDGDKGLLDLIY